MTITLGTFTDYLLASCERKGVRYRFDDFALWQELFYRLKCTPDEEGKPAFLSSLFFGAERYPMCQELLQYLYWGLMRTGTVLSNYPQNDLWWVDPETRNGLLADIETLDAGTKAFLAKAVLLAQEVFSDETTPM